MSIWQLEAVSIFMGEGRVIRSFKGIFILNSTPDFKNIWFSSFVLLTLFSNRIIIILLVFLRLPMSILHSNDARKWNGKLFYLTIINTKLIKRKLKTGTSRKRKTSNFNLKIFWKLRLLSNENISSIQIALQYTERFKS